MESFFWNYAVIYVHLTSIFFWMRLSTWILLTIRFRCKTETFTWWSESTVFILRISLTLDKQMCPLFAFVVKQITEVECQQPERWTQQKKITLKKKQLLRNVEKQYSLPPNANVIQWTPWVGSAMWIGKKSSHNSDMTSSKEIQMFLEPFPCIAHVFDRFFSSFVFVFSLIILIEKFFTWHGWFSKHKMIENTDYNWVCFNDSINRI